MTAKLRLPTIDVFASNLISSLLHCLVIGFWINGLTLSLTHTWDVVVGADPVREEPVPDLPGEDGRTLALVVGDPRDHARGRHAGLRAADRSGLDRPGLIVSANL